MHTLRIREGIISLLRHSGAPIIRNRITSCSVGFDHGCNTYM